jgi:peptidoglycan/LPS O-acetylase OafA/YrhL
MNRQLAALSGLAIILVVLHHTIDLEVAWFREAGITLAQDWRLFTLVTLHRLGKVAVPLFLFISGGFIAYAVRGNPPRLSWQSVSSALRRLIWPYALWSVIFYIMVYFQRAESYSLMGYLKNLAVGYPFHFVPLLIFFYAISPLLAYLAKRMGFALLALFALGQLLLIGVEFPGILGFTFPAWSRYLSLPVLGETMALWGIYFPLGLIFALRIKEIQPWIHRFRWLLLACTLSFFVLDVLHTLTIVRMPIAVHVYPFTAVLLTPLIRRNWIPLLGEHEYVGKRSYGLYLTHLLIVNLALLGIEGFAPWLFNYPLLLVGPVFVLALGIPLLVMHLLSAPPTRNTYRYVFG